MKNKWLVHGNPCASLDVNGIMAREGFPVASWDFLCTFRYGDAHGFPCSSHENDDHSALYPGK